MDYLSFPGGRAFSVFSLTWPQKIEEIVAWNLAFHGGWWGPGDVPDQKSTE